MASGILDNSMNMLPKILTLVSVSLLAKELYTIFKKIKEKFVDREINDVLVFYEDYYNCGKPLDETCTNQTCTEHSFNKLVTRLNAARVSIDLCIYTVSCRKIIDVLIRASKRGVCVRLITDMESITSSNRLYYAGIPLRYKRSTHLMHHKFCIIDGAIRQAELLEASIKADRKVLPEHKYGFVMYGSMNWTTQATTGNYENLVLTNDTALVLQFEMIFNEIWEDFKVESPKTVEMPIDHWNEKGY